MAKKAADKRQFKVDLNKGFEQVKETVGKTNDFIYETSEDLVEVTIKRTGDWQEVQEKAVKGGLKLVATQQDLIFDTLEMVKSQMLHGRKRFKSLFSKN